MQGHDAQNRRLPPLLPRSRAGADDAFHNSKALPPRKMQKITPLVVPPGGTAQQQAQKKTDCGISSFRAEPKPHRTKKKKEKGRRAMEIGEGMESAEKEGQADPGGTQSQMLSKTFPNDI